MSLYRRERSPYWWCQFKDHNGIRRRMALAQNKEASDLIQRNIRRLVDYRVAEGRTDPGLLSWVSSLPSGIHRRLVDFALVDAQDQGRRVPLTDHLEQWAQALLAQGVSQKQANLKRTRCRSLLLEECGFSYGHEINAEDVNRGLHRLQHERKRSQRTRNHYLQSAKQFERWLYQRKSLGSCSLDQVRPISITTEATRGVLTPAQAQRLLDYCMDAPEIQGKTWSMSGPQRAMLYRMALQTGLRANELRQLKRHHVDLARGVVTINAESAKSRRQQTVALRPDLASDLGEFLQWHHPGSVIFDMPKQNSATYRYLLKPDLTKSGLPLTDETGGKLDFHALRHTFVTWLSNAGASSQTVQALARHSDLSVTQRYLHSTPQAEQSAVVKLPSLQTLPDPNQVLAAVGGECGAQCGAHPVLDEKSGDDTRQPPGVIADIDDVKVVANAPRTTRTSDLRFRRPLLYPTELSGPR